LIGNGLAIEKGMQKHPQAAEKVPLLCCRCAGQSSRMFEYAAVARLPAPCRMNFFNSLPD